MRLTALLLMAGAVGVLSLAGRGEPEPSALLTALKAEPMAQYVPPRADLVATRQQDQGSALGKGFLVGFSRDFYVPGEVAEASFLSARRKAQADRWRFDGRTNRTSGEFGSTTGASASKTVQGNTQASLTIVLLRPANANSSAPATLKISLTSGNNQATE